MSGYYVIEANIYVSQKNIETQDVFLFGDTKHIFLNPIFVAIWSFKFEDVLKSWSAKMQLVIIQNFSSNF